MKHNNTTSVSAPGCVTLFGDHAVNFGEAAIGLAIDLRYTCDAVVSNKFSVNNEELDAKRHPWIRGAIIQGWTDMDKPIALTTHSTIPMNLKLGEPAARTVACLGSISMLHNHLILEEVARKAFEVNYDVNEFSHPLDVATSTHGSAIYISGEKCENHMWSVKKAEKTWHIHSIAIPEADIVIGSTGLPGPQDTETRIRKFFEKNAFARDLIKDIGTVSKDGARALLAGDIEKVGRLMADNHKLLVNLGVGGKELGKLHSAMSRNAYGAKLSGNGGYIIALTDKASEVVRSVESAGGQALHAPLSIGGIRLEDETDT